MRISDWSSDVCSSDLSPTPAQLDALISPAVGAFGLQNVTGTPYDPTTVYAVVDARSQNTAFQAIEGVDLSAQYRFDLPTGDALLLNAAGSYLTSERRVITGQPRTPPAGGILIPPLYIGRASRRNRGCQ